MGVSKVALRRRPITGAKESLYLDFILLFVIRIQ